MKTELTLKQLLTENFLKWQNELGILKTQKEFAEQKLDIHEVTFSRYFNEQRTPSKAILVQFAEKTGDPRFYDLANAPRPDPDFQYIRSVWEKLSQKARASIREQAEEYASVENEQGNHR